MDHVDRILAQWRAERPDLDVAPMGLLGRLARLRARLEQALAPVWARHGLSAQSFDMLATLRRAGPPFALSAGALAELMMLSSGAMTTRIDQLEVAGLATRKPDPKDRRGRVVSLTEKGFAIIDAAIADHVAAQAALTAGLSAEERATLDTLLRRWDAALPASAPTRRVSKSPAR